MQNQINIFQNPDFGQIRILRDAQGEPLFCLKDVCMALLLDGKQVNRRLDKGVVSKHPLQTMGGTQMATFVNEDGLYDVILDSRKPEAKAFRKWVTSEVLPQIRKTGGYIHTTPEMSNEEIMARALMVAQATIEQKEKLLVEAQQTIEEQKPMVLFAVAITASEGSILIGDMAKLITQNGYEIGRTRLFQWLRDHGYLFKNENRPYQVWVEKGLFEVSETLVQTHHGSKIVFTTKVTPKGQQYFLEIFKKYSVNK